MELTAKGTSPQKADCHDTRFVVVGIGVGDGTIVVERSMRDTFGKLRLVLSEKLLAYIDYSGLGLHRNGTPKQ